jgi:hypothetical protein
MDNAERYVTRWHTAGLLDDHTATLGNSNHKSTTIPRFC